MANVSGAALILAVLSRHTPLTSQEAADVVHAIPAAAIPTPGTFIAQLNTGTATTAQIATALNTLLTELQTLKILASS